MEQELNPNDLHSKLQKIQKKVQHVCTMMSLEELPSNYQSYLSELAKHHRYVDEHYTREYFDEAIKKASNLNHIISSLREYHRNFKRESRGLFDELEDKEIFFKIQSKFEEINSSVISLNLLLLSKIRNLDESASSL